MKSIARLAPFAPLLLVLGLAAPAAAGPQYGAGPSGPTAGATYKQALGARSFGAGQYGGPRGKSGYGAGHAAPRAHSGFAGYGHPAPRKVWVAGHWALREREVWVAGRTETLWRPARFETRVDACGFELRVLVAPGGYETVQHPGRWERRTQRVWVAGQWQLVR